MTYLAARKRFERQMNLLIDFLPYCENNEQRFRILDEVQELKYKIQRIERMYAKYDEVRQHTEEWNSKINFEETILRIA